MPGEIAAQLSSPRLILLVWALCGVYSLLGAISLSELGAALPQAGGFYVYSKRAFGPAAGFAMGWADWLNNCASLAYVAVTAAEYLLALFPTNPNRSSLTTPAIALGLLLFFGLQQLFGLRLSSRVQKLTCTIAGITFLALVIACLLHARYESTPASPPFIPTHGAGIFTLLIPIFAVLPALVVAYDGWYEAIYFTEEDRNAAKNLPRAMIGGVLLVTTLYLLMNLAFLHVLTIPQLAGSKLAAADAAQRVFPAWSGTFITLLSLFTLLGFINATLLAAPRILFAVGRDGLFRGAATVDRGGTPRIALFITAVMVVAFVLIGKFDEIIGVAAILMAVMYCVNYAAVFVLRFREPYMTRPFRAWGYPVTTALVLIGSLTFLIGDVQQDHVSALRAAILLLLALPIYWWRGRNLNLTRTQGS